MNFFTTKSVYEITNTSMECVELASHNGIDVFSGVMRLRIAPYIISALITNEVMSTASSTQSQHSITSHTKQALRISNVVLFNLKQLVYKGISIKKNSMLSDTLVHRIINNRTAGLYTKCTTK